MLRSAIDDALSRGDGDFCEVDIGRVFVDGLFMLRAYESYCTRQVWLVVPYVMLVLLRSGTIHLPLS